MFKTVLTNGVFFSALLIYNTVATAEVELSGYYKNLLIRSATLSTFPDRTTYLVNKNRLRLHANGDIGENIYYDIQYDNEIYLGNYLDTNQFAFQKKLEPDTEWDLEHTYMDDESVYGKHLLYRAFLTATLSSADIRIGRQRITWGTAMLWNPMDILNPFNPVQLERQERQGIDAIMVDWNYGALSRVSAVYAKQRSGDSRAMRWLSHFTGTDISLMLGEFRDNKVGGLDFASQIDEIGIRGEMTFTDTTDGDTYVQSVVGFDYTFPSTLSFNVEAYYNGKGSSRTVDYDFSRLLTGKAQSLAKHYLGGYVGYDITPLLQSRNYLICNLDDRSMFLAPSLTYSISDNTEGVAGIQIYKGDSDSEFGLLENIYYFQIQHYF
jgi:hypothetical protein